jgi:hypothetical protein
VLCDTEQLQAGSVLQPQHLRRTLQCLLQLQPSSHSMSPHGCVLIISPSLL